MFSIELQVLHCDDFAWFKFCTATREVFANFIVMVTKYINFTVVLTERIQEHFNGLRLRLSQHFNAVELVAKYINGCEG